MAGLKQFKSLKSFQDKLKTSCCWEDYFKIGGRMYKIFEYGGGWKKNEPCYVYFYNKRSKTMLKVDYMLNTYKFLNFEVENDPFLWRTDTL